MKKCVFLIDVCDRCRGQKIPKLDLTRVLEYHRRMVEFSLWQEYTLFYENSVFLLFEALFTENEPQVFLECS